MATTVLGSYLRSAPCTCGSRPNRRRRIRKRSWTRHHRRGDCHQPAIYQQCSRARALKVRAAREQVPLTIAGASTLYTLQGTTATPGLIYHFRTPRRISNVMKWISTYMALSRIQSLSQLRSIGLNTDIRDLINGGPPEGFLTRFLKIFEEKISATQQAIEAAMAELNWIDVGAEAQA